MPNPISFLAEFACIHEGQGEYLRELASAAKDAGATGVKFQIFDANEVVSADHPDHEYFKSISFAQSEWVSHIQACSEMDLEVWVDLSGAFSTRVVEEAEGFVTGIKIHSADIDNPIVLAGVKKLGLPVMIGCGGTPLIDLFELLDRLGPTVPVTLMHGYQAFPKLEGAPGGPPAKGVVSSELELWRIRQLVETFPMATVGLSEHLAGEDPMAVQTPALAAVLGARVIEKHVTIRRSELREDYFSSIEPAEFATMVQNVTDAMTALGYDQRTMGEGERGYQREMKRAPLAKGDLSPDTTVTFDSMDYVRDGSYQAASRAGRAVGQQLQRPVAAGDRITDADIKRKVGVFCNARYGSSRLPGKALLPFYGELNTLGYLLTRLVSFPGEIGDVVLATTTLPEDDALEAVGKQVGVPVIRGEVQDVMGRMLQAADARGGDTLVRVTGDDQLISCEYIQRATRYHLAHSLDYTRIQGLPEGLSCEVIDVRTLRRIHAAVVNKQQTEQFTWYLDSAWTCRSAVMQAEPEHSHDRFRITLDYPQDYDLMREVAKRAHEGQSEFYIPIERIIEKLIEIDPEWLERPELWTYERHDVNTELRFDYASR